MRQTGLYYTVAASLEFSRPDLEVLIEIGSHHYDGLCRQTAREGFLSTWLTQMEHVPEWRVALPVEVTTRRMDIMVKILEMAGSVLHGDEHKQKIAGRIGMGLRAAFLDCNKEWKRLNKPEEREDATA